MSVHDQLLSVILSRVISFIVIFLFSIVISDDQPKPYDADTMAPVILVPGVGGTQLDGKWHTHHEPESCFSRSFGWDLLWLDWRMGANPFKVDCYVYRLSLLYNRTTHRCSNQEGVRTRVPGKFGNVKPVIYLTNDPLTHKATGYYHVVVKRLQKLGYSKDTSIYGFGYDWRYGPTQIEEWGLFDQLAALVERIANSNKRKVTIISHSMGGLMMAYFLRKRPQAWKDKYINSWIPISTPWLGSPNTLEVEFRGNNFGISTVSRKLMKKLGRTFQSGAFLLPAEDAYKDTVLLEWTTKNKNYTSADYKELFQDANLEDVYLMREDLRSLFPVPLDKIGVKIHCIYSKGVPKENLTVKKYIMRGKTLDSMKHSTIVYDDGDSAVPMKSLEYCTIFKSSNIDYKRFDGPFHTYILTDDNALNYLMTLLKNASSLQ